MQWLGHTKASHYTWPFWRLNCRRFRLDWLVPTIKRDRRYQHHRLLVKSMEYRWNKLFYPLYINGLEILSSIICDAPRVVGSVSLCVMVCRGYVMPITCKQSCLFLQKWSMLFEHPHICFIWSWMMQLQMSWIKSWQIRYTTGIHWSLVN